MLANRKKGVAGRLDAEQSTEAGVASDAAKYEFAVQSSQDPLTRVLRVEWLGQAVASACWIASVFAYGISSTGDWLQLAAATAWFIANVASLYS